MIWPTVQRRPWDVLWFKAVVEMTVSVVDGRISANFWGCLTRGYIFYVGRADACTSSRIIATVTAIMREMLCAGDSVIPHQSYRLGIFVIGVMEQLAVAVVMITAFVGCGCGYC